jgi:hypothetical protein
MSARGEGLYRPDTAQGVPKLRDGNISECPSLPSTPEHDEGSAVHFTPAGGRQTRPHLTPVKSGKKKLFPMGEHAQHRIFHLQGLPCSRKS